MKVRIVRLDGGSEEIEYVTRIVDFSGDRDATLADDTQAAAELGLERTIFLNSEQVVAVVIDETPGAAREPTIP